VRVGLFAPDFALKDSDGQKVRLSDFREVKNVLLFFCAGQESPPCPDWLDQLGLLLDELGRGDLEILALSLDERWTSRRLKTERQIRFPILKIEADGESFPNTPPVNQQYSVEVNQPHKQTIYPAIFLVDKLGIVRYRKVYLQAADKPDFELLLCELNQLV